VIVWDIPCDPNNTATISGVSRNQGEGLLCYLLRVFQQFNPASYINLTSPQTISNKTFTTSIFSGGSITGATISGCTYSDVIPRASVSNYLLGSVVGSVPYQSGNNVTTLLAPGTSGQVLTSGGANASPYWAAATTVATSAQNLTGGGAYTLVYQQSGGNTQFLTAGTAGYILQCNGNTAAPTWVAAPASSTTATNLAGTLVGSIPYQASAGNTNYIPAGDIGQVLFQNSSRPAWIDQSSLAAGKATNLDGTTAWSLPYQSASATTSYVSPGTAGQVLTSNGSAAPVWKNPSTTFKNKIVNGSCAVNQWNTAGKSISVAGDIYFADMFFLRSTTAGNFWAYRFTGPGGWLATSPYDVFSDVGLGNPPSTTTYLGVRTANAITPNSGALNALCHVVELPLVTDILATQGTTQPFVLSFYVYASVTGTYSGCINNVQSFNNPYFRVFPFNYTVTVANTWQKVTVTVPADSLGSAYGQVYTTEGAPGLSILWDLGSGTAPGGGVNKSAGAWADNNTGVTSLARSSSTGLVSLISNSNARLYVGQIQLELGSIATSFEILPPTTNIQNCQRNFESSYANNSNAFFPPGTASSLGGGERVRILGPSGFTMGSHTIYFATPKTNGGSGNFTIYSSSSGASNKIYDRFSLSDLSYTLSYAGAIPFNNANFYWTQPSAAGIDVQFQWAYNLALNTQV